MVTSKNKNWITAEELHKRLDADPEYKKKMEEKRAKRLREVEASRIAAEPMFRELNLIGVDASSFKDLENKYSPVSKDVVNILLKWLPKIDAINIQMCILSILKNTKKPFNGSSLAEYFEASTNWLYDNLRWSIADTIASAKVTGLEEWVIEAIQNPKYYGAREMLCFAVAKMHPPEKAIPVLMSVYDQLPIHATNALGKIGNELTITYLRKKNDEFTVLLSSKKNLSPLRKNILKSTQRAIKDAIRKIEKECKKTH